MKVSGEWNTAVDATYSIKVFRVIIRLGIELLQITTIKAKGTQIFNIRNKWLLFLQNDKTITKLLVV